MDKPKSFLLSQVKEQCQCSTGVARVLRREEAQGASGLSDHPIRGPGTWLTPSPKHPRLVHTENTHQARAEKSFRRASGSDSSEEKYKEQSIHQPRLCTKLLQQGTKLAARRTAGQERTSRPDLMNNFPAENV